jgi:hypothetical protein
MGDPPVNSSIQLAWVAFVNSTETLMVPELPDSPLFQFVQFRDNTLSLVRSAPFLTELQVAWTGSADYPMPEEVRNLLLLELQAFPLAVQVAERDAKTATNNEPEKKWWKPIWRERASTVAGSAKDLLDIFKEGYPLVKGGITALQEGLDLFKGNK